MLPSNEVTMSSIDFLNDYINPARIEAGENALEHSKLMRKIEDECDDLGVSPFWRHPQNGQSYKVHSLTKDQMMLVGMRESKTVRKSVLAKLKQLTTQPQFELPKTFAEALRLAADQQQQLDSITAQSVAKATPQSLTSLIDGNSSSVYQYLVDAGYLRRVIGGYQLTKKGIDSGYGVQISKNGVRWIPELVDILPPQAFETIPLPAPKKPRVEFKKRVVPSPPVVESKSLITVTRVGGKTIIRMKE